VLTLEFWRSVPEWYQFMGAAAAAVAGANADALIIAGGTDSESLLAYIATQPLLPLGVPGHECGLMLPFFPDQNREATCSFFYRFYSCGHKLVLSRLCV